MVKTRWNEFYVLPESMNIYGIVLFGIVLLRKDVKHFHPYRVQLILNHERIHVRQWLELFFVGFILLYLFESWVRGYYGNVLEKEAYHGEKYDNYLKSRGFWAFIKFYKR